MPEMSDPEVCRQRDGLNASGVFSLQLLNSAAESLALSARGYHRVMKVARTIADLDRSERIGSSHVAEAIRYRPAASRA